MAATVATYVFTSGSSVGQSPDGQRPEAGVRAGRYLSGRKGGESVAAGAGRAGPAETARLPVGKTLAEYDFGQVPELNAAQVRQLCETTDWVDSGENVLLFGASGLGKSHLAAALVDGGVSQGYRVRFYSAGELPQELRKTRSLLRLNKVLLKLARYRVIVIDDLGYVKRDNAETGVLFELIAHRYERGSLIITSNHPFSTWGNIFVEETMAVAAADRLIHRGYIFEVTGESYRKKMSKAAIQQSAKQ